MTRRTLRPRPFDNKKKLAVVHEAAGVDLNDTTVVRSVANRNSELEKNNDKVVTVASKSGEEIVPVPGFRPSPYYEQLYPKDFKHSDDMNAEYLTSGKNYLPLESQCVEYAADSEDEEWLEANVNTQGQDRLSAVNFEKLVWKLEMANFMVAQHMLRKAGASVMERKAKVSNGFVIDLSKAAAVKLLRKHEGFDATVIERVYEYWVRKRRSRREPLLRTLQPKTAANDRDPDHTFREREKVKRPNTRRRRHVNRGDNVEEKLNEIKDEMGHACNVFKSMVNRESVKAHVVNIYISQKRILLDKLAREDGQRPSELSEIRKDQEKKERYLKRDDAEYRAKTCRFLLQNVFHGELRKMFAAARGTEGEGGCDAAISRRMRKAQKRRQKVISFLVQDRNWQKWHDKTWMQKMYMILKKRSLLSRMTRFVNQRNTWKRWEAFVKLTRDRRLRKMMDAAQKKRLQAAKIAKTAKKPKAVAKLPSDPKPDASVLSDTTAHSASGSPHDGKGDKQFSSTGDGNPAEAISQTTVAWAQRQGISPPRPPAMSRTISIPSVFVVPQNGFSCLPPRLKEMYSEAEKDVSQSPEAVAKKVNLLKTRRQRILQLTNEEQMERSAAVVQFNQESKQVSDVQSRKRQLGKLKRKVLSDQALVVEGRVANACDAIEVQANRKSLPAEVTSGQHQQKEQPSVLDVGALKTDGLSVDNYAECRQKLLMFFKLKVQALKQQFIQNPIKRNKAELQKWMDRFWKLKAAKDPELDLIESLVRVCSESSAPKTLDTNSSDAVSDSRPAENGQLGGEAVKSAVHHGANFIDSDQQTDCRQEKTASPARKKRVSLVKRHNRKMVLDVRMGGQSQVIDLKPGHRILFNPFSNADHQLDVDQMKKCLQQSEPPAQHSGEAAAEGESVHDNPEHPEGGDVTCCNWNAVYSREGPVVQVPVQCHRMIKAQSAPVLVTDDSCPLILTGVKAAHKKLSVGVGASRRLLKGRGISLPALKKRQELRRSLLKPFLPKIESRRWLPKTKSCKIKALSNVDMDVPSRPERKPLFAHVFKLNAGKPSDKMPANVQLPHGAPAELAQTGIARLGRGSRIWIDRSDPLSMQTFRSGALTSGSTAGGLHPTLRRVLKADDRKTRAIRKQCSQHKLSRQQLEEKRIQKVNQIQESAAQLANRQQHLLPHCVVQEKTDEGPKKEAKKGRKRDAADARKEAQRLHATALELGLHLPMEQLNRATLDTAVDMETIPAAKSPTVQKQTDENPKIKTEPLETTGPVQGGAQVTCRALASPEDLNARPGETHQVMCPLGCIKREEMPVENPQQPHHSDDEVMRTTSASVVDIDYLSTIAPRRPRTSMDGSRSSITRSLS